MKKITKKKIAVLIAAMLILVTYVLYHKSRIFLIVENESNDSIFEVTATYAQSKKKQTLEPRETVRFDITSDRDTSCQLTFQKTDGELKRYLVVNYYGNLSMGTVKVKINDDAEVTLVDSPDWVGESRKGTRIPEISNE